MDSLGCPVCFTTFEGRIFQCSQGHAVCESCLSKLDSCPQCRKGFSGTRNFALEDVINRLNRTKQLEKERLTKTKGKSKKATAQTDKNKKKTSIEANVSNAVGVTSVIARPPGDSDDDHDDHDNVSDVDVDIDQDMLLLLNAQHSMVMPIEQASGQFKCRMIGCTESLPICRLLNHIRYCHKNHLIELVNNLSSVTEGNYLANWKVRANTFCKTIFIKKSGLFFLIINVKQLHGKSEITGWVQKVGTNEDARGFRFTLRIKIGLVAAVYSSYVYGAQSDNDYILRRQQCLYFMTAAQNKNMEIALEIGRNRGPKDQRRLDNTVVAPIALEQSTSRRPPRTHNLRGGRGRGGGAGNSASNRGGGAGNRANVNGGRGGGAATAANTVNVNSSRGGGAAPAATAAATPANTSNVSSNSSGGSAGNSSSVSNTNGGNANTDGVNNSRGGGPTATAAANTGQVNSNRGSGAGNTASNRGSGAGNRANVSRRRGGAAAAGNSGTMRNANNNTANPSPSITSVTHRRPRRRRGRAPAGIVEDVAF